MAMKLTSSDADVSGTRFFIASLSSLMIMTYSHALLSPSPRFRWSNAFPWR
jgi:hypothetical protein